MEEFQVKYLASCQEANYIPNEGIMHALRSSKKVNDHEEQDQSFWPLLDFSGCNISVGDCHLLAKCLATDTYVEDLRFTDCLLCEEACQIVLGALSFNKTLRRLDLKGNNLRGTGAELVGKLLKRTATLHELCLEWNSLGMWDSGITAIAEGLAMNQTLQIINLSNNQMSHEAGSELAQSLKRNRTLKHLDLRWNNIGVLGGRAFASAVQHNKSVIKLHLGGNNIPADVMKSITSAVQRNVDCQSVYDEHNSVTKSLRREIDQLEHEKSMQVTTLLDQLEKEKELHDSLAETTRDRLEQMREVLDERKAEIASLKSKYESAERNAANAKQQVSDLMEEVEKLKAAKSLEQERLEKVLKDERLKLETDIACHQKDIKEKSSEISNLQQVISDSNAKNAQLSNECKNLQEALVKKQESHDGVLESLKQKNDREKETLNADFEKQLQGLNDKLKRCESERAQFEEDVSRLKTQALADKLRADEELMNARTRWKQEELLKVKQYDDRIEMMQNVKDELQNKSSKLSVQLAEVQTQLTGCQKDCEVQKRQIEHQRQVIDQKDIEHRNEVSRMHMDLESERRIQSELKDKVSSLEKQNQDISTKLKETITTKDAEIARLQEALKSRESEIDRIREEELRRAGMLESALHTYIMGVRSTPRK